MDKNANLLKHSYRLSLTSSLLCLLESLFMVIPTYWISALVFSLEDLSDVKNRSSFILASLLILITLSKICLSITSVVFGAKTRRQYRFNKDKFYDLDLILSLAIINSILPAILVTSLFLGLEINFLMYINVIISILLIISAILLYICHYKLKSQNNK